MVAGNGKSKGIINNKHIKSMDIEDTGGRVVLYYGQLVDGNWYTHSDLTDIVCIFDKEPLKEDWYEDEYEWYQTHLIKEISNKEARDMFIEMDNLVDQCASEPNWNKLFHNHLQEMIEMDADNIDEYEI